MNNKFIFRVSQLNAWFNRTKHYPPPFIIDYPFVMLNTYFRPQKAIKNIEEGILSLFARLMLYPTRVETHKKSQKHRFCQMLGLSYGPDYALIYYEFLKHEYCHKSDNENVFSLKQQDNCFFHLYTLSCFSSRLQISLKKKQQTQHIWRLRHIQNQF